MNLLYLAAIVFVITTVIYASFSALSNKIGVYRITNDNKKIAKFAGGVLTFSFIISALLMYFEGQYFDITLSLRSVVELSIALAILFALGYYFDNTQLVGKKKIIREAVVFVILALVTTKTNLVTISAFSEVTNFVLSYISNLLTEIAWYLIIVNGMNVLRKIDKLVSGISFITSLSFFLLSLLIGNTEFTAYALILCVNSLFLTLFNVHVNNIIGLSFGFILAYLGLNYLTAGPTLIITAVVSLSMPIFNLLYVVWKRIKKGTIISLRDDEHVFYRMKNKRYSNVRILAIMYIVTFCCAICGFAAVKLDSPYYFIGCVLILTWFAVALENQPAKTGKIKVMSIFGTRPEAIKMAPVIKELEKDPDIDSVVCVTGQHKEMLYQVLDAFSIYPRYDLNIMRNRQSLVGISSRILHSLEKVVKREKPDMILVHGDTSSTFVAAFLGFYMNVKVGHVEAGLRTYNIREPFPEEMNRVLTSPLASIHFSPSEKAKQNLLKEGISEEIIYLTGNTAVDSTRLTYKEKYNFKEQILNTVDFESKKVICMTAHRRENLGEPLENICKAVKRLVLDNEDVEVVYAVHKNPAVREVVYKELKGLDRVFLVEPLDVLDMHNLMKRSYMMLTDSGGLQEEAPSFHLPTIVLRNVTERPEGLETGILKLAGTDEQVIYDMASEILHSKDVHDKMGYSVNPYGDGHAARYIKNAIKYYFGLSTERPADFTFNVEEKVEAVKERHLISTEILGVRVDRVNMKEAEDIIFDFFTEDRLHIVHTTNPEFILKAQKDDLYKTILNGADLAVPDGIGTVIASKFKDTKLQSRVPGCDLALNLMDKMQGTDYSVYILGSSQANLENAIKNLKEKYPNLNIAGYHNGYFKDEDDEAIIEDINRSGATLLLVGMGGIDKQEKWVWKYKDRIKARVSIGVGGSIDVYGGAVKRAPKFYQKTNLEWLYRTMSEPKKRLPRVYKLPLFVVKAANESLFGPKKKKNK